MARHPETDATFLMAFSQMYAHSQAMLVRRLADHHKGSISLWQLVEQIRKNAKFVSRAEYTARHAEHFGSSGDMAATIGATEAQEAWQQHFGEHEHPDPDFLVRYQLELVETARSVTELADRRIAHVDPRATSDATVGEIHHAIDALAEELNRYNLLLNQTTRCFDLLALPVGWKECLRSSLFPLPIDRWAPDNVSFT